MKRRAALRKTGWILQSAVFGPGLISAIQSCQQQQIENDAFSVLSAQQGRLANAIADTIIPSTETASASQAKVVEFIDLLFRDIFDQDTVETFLTGLQEFDKSCQQETAESFTGLSDKQRVDYLEVVDRQVMEKDYDSGEAPFYYTFKKLCITVYFTSEAGITQNLDYRPIPGPYQGDVKMGPEDKIMRGNQM